MLLAPAQCRCFLARARSCTIYHLFGTTRIRWNTHKLEQHLRNSLMRMLRPTHGSQHLACHSGEELSGGRMSEQSSMGAEASAWWFSHCRGGGGCCCPRLWWCCSACLGDCDCRRLPGVVGGRLADRSGSCCSSKMHLSGAIEMRIV